MKGPAQAPLRDVREETGIETEIVTDPAPPADLGPGVLSMAAKPPVVAASRLMDRSRSLEHCEPIR